MRCPVPAPLYIQMNTEQKAKRRFKDLFMALKECGSTSAHSQIRLLNGVKMNDNEPFDHHNVTNQIVWNLF